MLFSVRPKCYKKETESLHCNLGGTDRSLWLDEMLQRETESLHSHLGETKIPISKTDLLRVCGSGYDFWNRWHRIGRIGVTDFGLTFRSFVEVGK